jgi:exonuclease III
LEAVCVEISKPHSRPLIFFENFEKLIKAIDDESKEMYILGDLNCDMLKTESDTPTKKIKSLYELYHLGNKSIHDQKRPAPQSFQENT